MANDVSTPSRKELTDYRLITGKSMDFGDDEDQFKNVKEDISRKEAENEDLELKLRPLCVRICRNCVEFKLERDFLFKECAEYKRQLEELKQQNDDNVRLLKKMQEENTRITEMFLNSTRKEILNNNNIDHAQNTLLPIPINVELPSLEEYKDTEDIGETPYSQPSESEEVTVTVEPDYLSELHASSAESCNFDSDVMVEDNDGNIVSQVMVQRDSLRDEWQNGQLKDDNDADSVPTLTCRWVLDGGIRCGTSFPNPEVLLSHVTTEHATRSRGILCCRWDPCRRNLRSFRQRHKLVDHMRRVHMDERLYRCQYMHCDMMFWNKKTAKRHGLMHMQQMPCKFPTCLRMFRCRKTMVEHYRVVHKNEQGLKCEVQGCGRIFEHPTLLEAHVLSHRTYLCDFAGCGQKLANQRALDKHRKIHQQVKSIECPGVDCGQKFAEESELQEHVKQHDPSTKFVCYVPVQVLQRP